MCHSTDYEHLQPAPPAPKAKPTKGRYRPCQRCGGSPAVHNPHPENPAYVGHEYV